MALFCVLGLFGWGLIAVVTGAAVIDALVAIGCLAIAMALGALLGSLMNWMWRER